MSVGLQPQVKACSFDGCRVGPHAAWAYFAQSVRAGPSFTDWMRVNSEGIYSTSPWKIYGEGPSTHSEKPGGAFNENKRKPLTAEDVRFATKGNTLYAFIMGWPEKEAVVRALGTASAQSPGKIVKVELLGHQDRLTWSQEASGLRVQLPGEKPSDYAVTLKVTFA